MDKHWRSNQWWTKRVGVGSGPPWAYESQELLLIQIPNKAKYDKKVV